MSPQKGKKRIGRPPGRKAIPPAYMVESEVMTLRAAADYLQCHYSTAFRLAQRGDIPCFKLGGQWRFLKSELDKWIAKGGSAPRYRLVTKTKPKS